MIQRFKVLQIFPMKECNEISVKSKWTVVVDDKIN